VRPKNRERIEAALWVEEGILDGTFEDWAVSLQSTADGYRIMAAALRELRARPLGSYRVFSSAGSYSTIRVALVADDGAGIRGERNKLWLELTAGELAQLVAHLDEQAGQVARSAAGRAPPRRVANGLYLDARVGAPVELPGGGGKMPGSRGSRR